MTDKEWEAFRAWWKLKYINSPDRMSIELWIEWMKARGGMCWTIEQLSAPDPAKGFYKE